MTLHLKFNFHKENKLILQLALLLTIIIVMAYSITYFSNFSSYYIPVSFVVMVAVILFDDLKLAFLMSVTTSLITGIITNSFSLGLIFLVSSLISSLYVWRARKWSQIFKAGLLVGIIQFALAVSLEPQRFFILSNRQLIYLIPLISNGIISSFLVISSLPIFENLFKVHTNISLLELSDFNHPLLKKMILQAPGTYHHSIIVGNLAEAASEAIGANSLLARVGAYYHDIGKIEKAEYFNENQLNLESKHTDLLPSMSHLVIINHVKEGLELAHKFKLSPSILDFIEQHHGTSLVHYFYYRALEHLKENGSIEKEEFRYPGPKPQTREVAIVHLADSVEAASRTLDEPTPARIEDLVRKILNNKFIDGQLDECDLALKDLEKISQTFTLVLSAIYHSRIKYPEDKNENKHHQSTEKNSHQSFPNKSFDKKDNQPSK